jgi:hypothetical protein
VPNDKPRKHPLKGKKLPQFKLNGEPRKPRGKNRPKADNAEWITSAQLAAKLNMSVAKLAQWDELRRYRYTFGNQVRYKSSDLENLFEACREV